MPDQTDQTHPRAGEEFGVASLDIDGIRFRLAGWIDDTGRPCVDLTRDDGALSGAVTLHEHVDNHAGSGARHRAGPQSFENLTPRLPRT